MSWGWVPKDVFQTGRCEDPVEDVAEPLDDFVDEEDEEIDSRRTATVNMKCVQDCSDCWGEQFREWRCDQFRSCCW